MICPFCLERNPGDHRTCSGCGNALRPTCGSCGRANPPVAFCQGCGEPLGTLKTLKGGDYRLIRILGKGGMGQTYLAVDRAGRRWALKEMLAAVADRAKVHELFTREAIALHNLSHPAIPRLVDYFVEGDRKVQVMEMVHGTALDRLAYAAGGKLPEHRVVDWMVELCDILDYIHGVGVIHRDIKPGNLLLRRSPGRLVLIDFGAVKEAGSPPGTIISTPGYAPFEQSQGTALAQSDLYSVGATIIALVTGSNPGGLYDTAQARFVGLEERGLSPRLAEVVRQVTSFLPAMRQGSARELKRALSAV